MSFSYNNEVKITHIETAKGVVGYNKKYPKPSWSVKCRITSEALAQISAFKNNGDVINVTFRATGLTVNVHDAVITKIDPGDVGDKVGEVTIEGLALKIEENWT
ncbi:hypothetical protein GAH_01747 [Geoglobus ahangari]|uniref:Phage tail protein n=1 Tax=Geoglobus ahangari TaxID=113653 RepID=A0A0F7IEY0_9EURY|nr:hypothetical protein [Geoglobus ahangari]AKG90974.1 hypothetical protein GAH_01747 [Geoglobus ahangari]